ncbi:hypothetical protein PRIPAC_74956 [Pristionchus pacificus]|uniref:Uncharacterized protein n=1 Tax=Pristionchus pacificus TaxID=54126 RepID=A0A2A6C0G9_PRIPA|nr:hypothetical protein PRIPAC_74956 [Pristionchus pacificus]|eukprot:PDM71587.1 hypothetical protein PRIPAC_37994 [Pristionchus pacificus]
MQSLVLCLLLAASALAATTDISRSKRQTTYLVYYMCNNNGQRFVSNYPCSYNYANYGYNYLPQNFYDPYNNCNSGCNNLSCNQYSGQYINGQYVAYSTSNSQYSPCASSCCAYNNGYNNGYNNNGGYTIGNGANPNVYPPAGVPPTPTNPPTSNPNNIGNGVLLPDPFVRSTPAVPERLLSVRVRPVNVVRTIFFVRPQASAVYVEMECRLDRARVDAPLATSALPRDNAAGDRPIRPLFRQLPRGWSLIALSRHFNTFTRRPNPPTRTLPPITTTTSTFPPITTSPGGNNGLQQCGPNRSCPNGSTCGDGNVCFPWIIGKK